MTYDNLLTILQDLKYSDPEAMNRMVVCIDRDTQEEYMLSDVTIKLTSKVIQLEISKIIDYAYNPDEEE